MSEKHKNDKKKIEKNVSNRKRKAVPAKKKTAATAARPRAEKRNSAFSAFQSAFTKQLCDLFPTSAIRYGLHKADGRIENLLLQGYRQTGDVLHRALSHITRINYLPHEEVDYHLLKSFIESKLYEIETLQMWQAFPTVPYHLCENVYEILGRSHVTLANRLRRIIRKMDVLSKMLGGSRLVLKKPVKYIIEAEFDQLTRFPAFFNTFKDLCVTNLKSHDVTLAFRALNSLQEAFDVMMETLLVEVLPVARNSKPFEPWAVTGYLKRRLVDKTPTRLLSEFDTMRRDLSKELEEAARKVMRGATVWDVLQALRSESFPTFQEMSEKARTLVKKSRAFMETTKICKISERDDGVVISETPVHMRGIYPLSYYWGCAPLDKTTSGYIFLAPGEPDADKLKDYNVTDLTEMMLRESYPGSHTFHLASLQNKNPMRFLTGYNELRKGWSYVASEIMQQYGYEDTPKMAFARIRALLQFVTCAIADLRFSLGEFDHKKAVAYISEHSFTHWPTAECLARRMHFFPLAYAIELYARNSILEFKKEATREFKVDSKYIYQFVVSRGNLPPSLLMKEFRNYVREHKPERAATPEVQSQKSGIVDQNS